MQGKVYIIGAGPGTYKLLTLRAVECIKRADVIVYDRLIDSKVLSFASQEAKLINVGKHPTFHQVPQKEINHIIKNLAKEGKIVARVKGGDCFLFGRGGEECEYLHQHGVKYEVIPGVSSSLAVPAYAGIPVTHRNYASSVHIITGHKSADKEGMQFDFETLAKVEGTLVFLMGIKNMNEICSGLLQYGKSGDTPVAIIEKGASADQRVITGILSKIIEIGIQQKVTSPAVIVIGEVASLSEKLDWFNKGILSGKRIVVTRPSEQAHELVDALEELGATVIEYPVIKIKPMEHYHRLEEALQRIKEFSWLVFTSVNGVTMFFDQLKQLQKDVRILHGLKFAVVGTATKKALEEKGIYADFVPLQFTTAHLCEGLVEKVQQGEKLLLLRSEIAGEELQAGLKKHNIDFENIAIYKTVENRVESSKLPDMLDSNMIDYVLFTSPSTVEAYRSLFGEERMKQSAPQYVCIGPVTAKAAREAGLIVSGVSEEFVHEGIIKKLLELSGSE